MHQTRPPRLFRVAAADRRTAATTVAHRAHRAHRADDAHGHTWSTCSRHLTSEGTVTYQRCRCGHWRALLGAAPVLQL